MNEYQLEQIYQLEQRKKELVRQIADEVTPVIEEYIQETIAWQTDGVSYDGDEYLEFAIAIKNEVIKQLNEDN